MMRVGAKRIIVVQSIRRASRARASALAVSARKPASVRIEWSTATEYHGRGALGAVAHPGRNTIIFQLVPGAETVDRRALL